MKNFCFAILMLGSLLSCTASRVGALEYRISTYFSQFPERDGSTTYRGLIHLRDRYHTTQSQAELTLVSPSGVRYTEDPRFSIDQVFASKDKLSSIMLNDEFSGSWTIEELLPDGRQHLYRFEVPAAFMEGVFPEMPFITAPSDGAILGPTFDITWEPYQEGRCSFTSNPRFSGDYPVPERTCHGDGSATRSYLNVEDFSGIEFRNFRTELSRRDSSGISMVVPLTEGADSLFRYEDFERESYSPPIDFSVVPEPAMAWPIGCVLLVGFAANRRRGEQVPLG